MPGPISGETRRIPNRIFVGGVNDSINEDDLRKLFGQFGEIKEVHFKDRGDQNRRGHGFVTYKNAAMAALALKKGEGEILEVRGTKLNVREARRRNYHKKNDDSPGPFDMRAVSGPTAIPPVSQPAYGMASLGSSNYGQQLGVMPYYDPYNYQMASAFWPGYPPVYCPSSMIGQPIVRLPCSECSERSNSPTESVADSQSSSPSVCPCLGAFAGSQGDNGRNVFIELPPNDIRGNYRQNSRSYWNSRHNSRDFENNSLPPNSYFPRNETGDRHHGRSTELSSYVGINQSNSADRYSQPIVGERRPEQITQRSHTRR